MRWVPRRKLDHHSHTLARLLALALILYVAAGAGMAYLAGFDRVGTRALAAHWWWLGPAFGGFGVALVGYYFAYRGIRAADDGPHLDRGTMLAVVIAGFGGFLAQGGGALYEYALCAGGASRREAKVRAAALAGFEQGALALIVCPAAAVALILGVVFPRASFTWPWALVPLPGFLLAALIARRYRDRLRGGKGWRDQLGIVLDALHLVMFEILLRPRKSLLTIAGMMLFWAGDMFGLWATTSVFGYRMSALAVIVGLGSGMFITRRAAPLGGEGFLTVALVPTLWYGSGVPLAPAALGVLCYRLFTMWVPVLPGLLAVPALRGLGERANTALGRGGKPALQHSS